MQAMKTILTLLLSMIAASCQSWGEVEAASAAPHVTNQDQMHLGNFSVSLAVKDIQASKKFYEAIGFTARGGDIAQNWLILRNGTTTVGLFQGMFPSNIMTFNPGWGANAEKLDSFVDVRDLQAKFEAAGVELTTRADASTDGPASFTTADPDGNTILFDQHVPRGK